MTTTMEAYIAEWHEHKYGVVDDRIVGCKLAEESGEVCGALIKIREGRVERSDVADELGDVLIVLSVLAGRYGYTLEELREQRFLIVAAR
jgi:NTP pyrophosphatase (non-canonical NTP hydrolase)